MTISNTAPLSSSAVAAATSATAGAASASSGATLAQNFDQFLTLLTTQLRNQNPLDPLDTNQFTAQLVQFAGVEQQLKTNDTLSTLLSLNKTTTTSNAVGFIGATITADGAATQLKDGAAAWTINMPRGGSANITVKNTSGSVVHTITKSLTAGDQSYVWNGKTSTGASAPEGEYIISVDAKDVSGQPLTAKTEIKGVVDGVDLSAATPTLKIGAISVALDKVKTVLQAK